MEGPDREQTVLVVDDTPANLTMILPLLQPFCQVRLANSGEGALRAVKADPLPDLILLDVMMPEMDGHEVCRRLKADPVTHDIPVIFLTALSRAEDEEAGFDLGAVDYITKPIWPATLVARVKTHLGLKRANEQLRRQNADLTEAAALRDDVERITRHDLKSPLTAIIGVPQFLLMSADLTDRQRVLVQGIEEAGRRMLQMINMSLDLFKMERGTYEVQPHAVDLIAVARRVFFELESLAERKGVELVLRSGGKEPAEGHSCLAWGEELLCHSLLGNLCKNAVEASPDGARVPVELDAGTQVRVAIGNQGEVPDEIRGNFFGKFVTAGKQGGSGLGTYSAKLIAEVQNGSIALDTSTSGVTRVMVELPGPPRL